MNKDKLQILESKKLVGFSSTMNMMNDQTPELWKSFMTHLNEITSRKGSHLFSLQIYPDNWRAEPDQQFTKWAAVEVEDFRPVPEGMTTYSISGGLYAVFIHKGPAISVPETMNYIFGTWLPDSDYQIDQREHFEILEEDYSPTDPNATEQIWIPIRPS